MARTLLFLLCLLILIGGSAVAQEEKNMLVNGGFAGNLSGWTVEGNASISPTSPLAGAGSVRFGPGKSAVRQRYAIGGLKIVLFSANLRSDTPSTTGQVNVQCYDSHHHLLMDLPQASDPQKTAKEGDKPGIYFKTQAHTAYLIVSIEKTSDAPGYLYADSAELVDYDRDRVTHKPLCDLTQSMEPLWQGHTVYNETVLMYSEGGKPATGRLLYTPTHIISVQNYGLSAAYAEGRDYTVNGKDITVTPLSRMTSLTEADFPKAEFPWYDLDGRHIVVTYTHDDTWQGPIPHYAGDQLPHTLNKLHHHQPLTIVAQGDSITLGDNVSGYMQIPPYMPTWAELFVKQLAQDTGDHKISLYNTALGGMTSEWGLDNAESTVATLQPDLVILAFGMNDFWSLSGDEFRTNIQGIIAKVRARQPNAEFILITSMKFDPAYTADPMYTGHMASYVTALKSLTGPGVCLLDMNAISGALFAAKKPTDLIANPLHPNDFLARWYAQSLVAMLTH